MREIFASIHPSIPLKELIRELVRICFFFVPSCDSYGPFSMNAIFWNKSAYNLTLCCRGSEVTKQVLRTEWKVWSEQIQSCQQIDWFRKITKQNEYAREMKQDWISTRTRNCIRACIPISNGNSVCNEMLYSIFFYLFIHHFCVSRVHNFILFLWVVLSFWPHDVVRNFGGSEILRTRRLKVGQRRERQQRL